MPVITLTEPFMRHYAGSVFHVSDAIGYSGWDEDDRVRDRQSFYDKRVYTLPDNGKGIQTELPLSSTVICPYQIFENVDLKSGPCRVTSVSDGLVERQNDPFYEHPLPRGMGKVLLQDTAVYPKNLVKINFPPGQLPNKVIIRNRIDNEIADIMYEFTPDNILDFSEYKPGFYRIDIFHTTTLLHNFTLMKCFPLVVYYNRVTRKFRTEMTLW
mgnify:CR=1 FL=1